MLPLLLFLIYLADLGRAARSVPFSHISAEGAVHGPSQQSTGAEDTRITSMPGYGDLGDLIMHGGWVLRLVEFTWQARHGDISLPAGYCRYLPVDLLQQRHLYYVFVESARDQQRNADPLILWLNGGPGQANPHSL